MAWHLFIIRELSKQLTLYYGKGFSETNLRNAIKFAQVYPSPQIPHTLCEKLSWSHIRELIYIDDELKREFYIELCAYERWRVRTLQKRIDSMLFERTAISKKPELTIKGDLVKLRGNKELSPALTFRDPYVLVFLGLHDSYSEKDLENVILRRRKEFLVEIGSDFAFMGQQKRITIDLCARPIFTFNSALDIQCVQYYHMFTIREQHEKMNRNEAAAIIEKGLKSYLRMPGLTANYIGQTRRSAPTKCHQAGCCFSNGLLVVISPLGSS